MRQEYIVRQKTQHGRKALAVLPVHYPKEILTALDVLAVELWGPPGPPRGNHAERLQTYVCQLARNALAFLAAGKADAVDGVLFPHTCDSIQGLATMVTDFGGWGKKAFTFLHPKGPPRPSSRAFLDQEMRSLAREIEAWTGRTLDEAKLTAAIRLHREIDEARASLLDTRRRSQLSDTAFYALLRRGEWLWPDEHLAELREARAAVQELPAQAGIPVMVTGYVPEPPSLLEVLNRAGAFVAADDYAAVGRRVVREGAGAAGDPWLELCERYWSTPPCPTRSTDQSGRMRHLARRYDCCGAKGLVVHVLKFCDPELFDVPAIRRTFETKGAPVLYLEGELEAELSAQTVTRVEAFVEMLDAGGDA